MPKPEFGNFSVVDGGLPDKIPASFRAESVAFGGGGGGGSGGGGSYVDAETKHYIDSGLKVVSAENSASFAKLGAKIDAIQPGATWQQIAAIAFVTVGTIFAVLAYASDRFDSGVGSMGAVEDALDAQRDINAGQDQRLDRILDALEAAREKNQVGPNLGQD